MEAKSSGEWFTRLNSDIWQAAAVVNESLHLPHAAVATVNILVSSIALLRVNQIIFGLVILFLIPYMVISQWFIAKPMTRLAKRSQEITAENTMDMNTLITCADTAMLYDAQSLLLHKFEDSSLKLRSTNMKMRNRSAAGKGLFPLMGIGGYLILLLVGSFWMKEGSLSFGEFTAAFQYRGGVIAGSMMLMNSIIQIKSSLAGVSRVNDTLKITLEE
jgi:ABC-type multidrug transport system fused ATPase/permease subunit